MELMEMVAKVQATEVENYDNRYTTLAECDAYEELFMAEVYYKAEQKLSEEYGTEIMLETSVQRGRGCVDAYTESGTGEHIATYSFEDETEALWELIKNWEGTDEEEFIEAAAELVVDMVQAAAN